LILAAAVSCFPPPFDETGYPCDDAHRCGPDFTCFDQQCLRPDQIDAGPDQLLVNGSFELLQTDGGISGWQTTSGDVLAERVTVHDGLVAAKLVPDKDAGTAVILLPNVPPVKSLLSGQAWCARAWLRANVQGGGTVQLNIRERNDAGTVLGQSAAANVKVGNSWLLLQEDYLAQGPPVGATKLDVTIRSVNGVLVPGEYLLVDDVRLKRTVKLPCAW
jgi:hypothetical protein